MLVAEQKQKRLSDQSPEKTVATGIIGARESETPRWPNQLYTEVWCWAHWGQFAACCSHQMWMSSGTARDQTRKARKANATGWRPRPRHSTEYEGDRALNILRLSVTDRGEPSNSGVSDGPMDMKRNLLISCDESSIQVSSVTDAGNQTIVAQNKCMVKQVKRKSGTWVLIQIQTRMLKSDGQMITWGRGTIT